MSSILVLLQNVHETVHVFNMKLNYSEPKIFTGGVDISQWNKLSKEEQKAALEKDWYIYYSFRHPQTGKLVRLPNIKGGINRIKNKAQRMKFLLKYQRALVQLLEQGYDPFKAEYQQPSEFIKQEEREPIIDRIVQPIETPKVEHKKNGNF